MHRTTTTAIVATCAVVALAGCSSATQGAQASAPSPGAASTPLSQVVETRNGTASFQIPEGWTIEDTSVLEPNHDGVPQWQNRIAIRDGMGVTLASYGDGPFSDAEEGMTAWGVVAERELGNGLAVTSWWTEHEGGGVMPHVELTQADAADSDEAPFGLVPAVDGRNAIFRGDTSAIRGCGPAESREAATACLESDAVAVVADVIASIQLTDVPWDAVPEGVDPSQVSEAVAEPQFTEIADLTTFVTQNDTMQVDLTSGWMVSDTSGDIGGDGVPSHWSNDVTFVSPDAVSVTYWDSLSAPDGPRDFADFGGLEWVGDEPAEGPGLATWWTDEGGIFAAHAGYVVLDEDGAPNPWFQVGERWAHLEVSVDSVPATFETSAEAEEFLGSGVLDAEIAMLETAEFVEQPAA